MQIGRLFEIVYLLMDRKVMSARELAERFEVSTRTIYRDVETLSQSGIPVYAVRGSGGGIRLTENFVLNKLVLSDEEQKSILASLQGLHALKVDGAGRALEKLSALFGPGMEWIEVNFSAWNGGDFLEKRFTLLKDAILSSHTVTFSYNGTGGNVTTRTVEPAKLLFRAYDWYLLAWCRLREEFRYFKLTRMGEPVIGQRFSRRPLPAVQDLKKNKDPSIVVTVRFAPRIAFRVYDEFPPGQRRLQQDGSLLVQYCTEENEWLYEYLLTYGETVQVLEPERVRNRLVERLRGALAQYEI